MEKYTCKPVLPVIILYLLSTSILVCQNFTGKITDNHGYPIHGSTVFIKEISQGLACNEEGGFQTNLQTGTYTVEYRCLGYENEEEKITIQERKPLHREIILKEKVFELSEVTISNKEDPAYEIMRNAIKNAPYHLNKVKAYEVEAYVKGNMELTKVSSLVDRLSSDDGLKLSDFKDKLFLQESYSTIKFTSPDKYEQTVTAFSSSIPNDFNPGDAMSIMQGSIYSGKFSGYISPLHPKSFSYYRFRYEGFNEEEGQVVNKIKIIPKVKDPELFSGYIYIADNSWDVRYAELSSNVYGFRQDVVINYSQIAPETYLPVTYTTKLEGGIMGVAGYFNYYSSMKYTDIQLEETVKAIDKKEEKEKKKKDYEIKLTRTHTTKTDSLATKRDSLFWADIRSIPLSGKEERSYEMKDSIQHHIDSLQKDYYNSRFHPTDLLTGGRIGGDSTQITFEFDGLARMLPTYNFVDGFWLGQKLKVSTHWNAGKNSLSISPGIYYTTARKDVAWDTDISFRYAPMQIGQLSIAFGDISADYNPTGVNRFDDRISTLFWGKNARMLYRKKYVSVHNEIDLMNGLRLTTRFQVAERNGLHNNTDYSFFGGKSQIKPNIYFPHDFDLSSYEVGISYTPHYYYAIWRGRKQYRYAKSPTFRILYTEGFSAWQTNNSRFRRVGGNISQSLQADLFSTFRYKIGGGKFLGNTDSTHFADFKHFNVSDVYLTTKSTHYTFMLLDDYRAATKDYWIEGHINYYSKYILLKRLPFLQGKLFNEELQIKYLYTPNKKNYMEAGYSIDLFDSLSLGAYCSFDKLKYESFGIRLFINPNITEF